MKQYISKNKNYQEVSTISSYTKFWETDRTKFIKSEASSQLPRTKQVDDISKFINDVTIELRVQYAVIIVDDHDLTIERKKLVKKVVGNLWKFDIRLSVQIFNMDRINASEVIPSTSSERPCIIFILSNNKDLLKKVSLRKK